MLKITAKDAVRIFEETKVRAQWNEEEEKWYFSVIDVVAVLSGTERPRRYWNDLKKKLAKEGSQLSGKIGQLKMRASDGKLRLTDCADTEQLFRLIQAIPSPQAEPFKLWLAEVARERVDQMEDPELSFEQAVRDYKRLGYSDNWINQRIKSIEIRKGLTDEWQRSGMNENEHFAALTDIIYKTWSGKSAREYKQFKGLKKESLRDNMTNTELVLNMLAETSTTDISKQKNPQGFEENADVAKKGGSVAKAARRQLEKQLGHDVVSPLSASRAIKKQLKDKDEND